MKRFAIRTAALTIALMSAPVSVLRAAEAISTDAPSSTDASSNALETITVTAEYKKENLQEIPIAITAVTADTMERLGLTEIQQLGVLAPDVVMSPVAQQFGGKSIQTYIRGVGQDDFNPAFEPAVGYYIDGVYYAVMYGSTFDLLDLDNVEILRGPQGTLFGKNTIGGAINMVSRAPQGDNSGWAQVTTGSLNRQDVSVGFDIPIVSDTLFLRVAALDKHQDGYVKVIDFACAYPKLAGSLPVSSIPEDGCRNGTEGGENVQAARASLRWLAASNLTLDLTGDYTHDDSEAQANTLLALSPGTSPYYAAWNAGNISRFGVSYDNRFIPSNPYVSYDTFSDPAIGLSFRPEDGVDAWGIAGKGDWNIGQIGTVLDNVHLKSITAYREFTGASTQDTSAAPLSIGTELNLVSHHQTSQELQLLGTAIDERLNWVVGVYYLNSYYDYYGLLDFSIINLYLPFADPATTEDKSVFAHAIFKITDKLSLAAGTRYTDEHKEFSYDFDYPSFFGGTFVATKSVSYSRDNPRADLNYQWTPDLMTYASVSTGFRGGGFNPRPLDAAQVTSFAPEDLTSYEIGLKSEWLEHRVQVNIASFYSAYKNIQIATLGIDSAGVPFSAPFNVATADIAGVEVEAIAHPVTNLQLRTSLSWLDVMIKSLGAYASQAGITVPPLDGTFVNSPARKADIDAQYTFNVRNAGTLTPGVNAAYQSKVFFDAQNSAAGAQGGYTVLNGYLAWKSPDTKWTVSANVTNLTNKLYYYQIYNGAAQGAVAITGLPAPPREWSMTLRRNF